MNWFVFRDGADTSFVCLDSKLSDLLDRSNKWKLRFYIYQDLQFVTVLDIPE